jgi:hypothetical protein
LLLLLVATNGRAQRAPPPCATGPTLPAYSHNDYENAEPLAGALRLGYAGVEADVFLVRGALLVAHDRRSTLPERSFEVLYLAPLREVVARCGRVLPGSAAFLLTVELKERSRPAYDSLTALLRRYPELFGDTTGADPAAARHVEVVLVGWHPPAAALRRDRERLTRIQRRITRLDRGAGDAGDLVRLVSLDYGRTIGRDPRRAYRWLAALDAAKRAAPGRITRVYNAPERADVYRLLMESGVDLIGTEQVSAARRVLLAEVR